MSGSVPEFDNRAGLRADELGFTDEAFDARYRGAQASVPNADRGGHAATPRPTPSGALRSRSSYMRARARRSAAASLSIVLPAKTDR